MTCVKNPEKRIKEEDVKSKGTFFKDHEVLDYEKKRYRGFDQKIVNWRERRIIKKLLKETKGEAEKVLDLPCGYGRFSQLLTEKVPCLISGDRSFAMVKRALDNRSVSDMTSKPGAVCDAVEGLPFKTGVFDGIFSMRFFHHLHSRNSRIRVLKEFLRTSSDWVIISFYSLNPVHKLQRRMRKATGKSRTNINMMSQKDFVLEAKEAGLYVKKISPLFKGLHSQHIALLGKTEFYPYAGLKGKTG
jgi:SAM-dependent methyltransferase